MDASAYLYKEIVLIDCDNPFFLELIRTNEFAKQSLHQAFESVTGRDYRIGPYRSDKYQIAQDKKDPMEEMLENAAASGIEVHVK